MDPHKKTCISGRRHRLEGTSFGIQGHIPCSLRLVVKKSNDLSFLIFIAVVQCPVWKLELWEVEQCYPHRGHVLRYCATVFDFLLMAILNQDESLQT